MSVGRYKKGWRGVCVYIVCTHAILSAFVRFGSTCRLGRFNRRFCVFLSVQLTSYVRPTRQLELQIQLEISQWKLEIRIVELTLATPSRRVTQCRSSFEEYNATDINTHTGKKSHSFGCSVCYNKKKNLFGLIAAWSFFIRWGKNDFLVTLSTYPRTRRRRGTLWPSRWRTPREPRSRPRDCPPWPRRRRCHPVAVRARCSAFSPTCRTRWCSCMGRGT